MLETKNLTDIKDDTEKEVRIPVRKHRWLTYLLFFQMVSFSVFHILFKRIDNGRIKVCMASFSKLG